MAATFSAIPVGRAIPEIRVRAAQQKELEAVARADLEAVLVTAHCHLRYLTGPPWG